MGASQYLSIDSSGVWLIISLCDCIRSFSCGYNWSECSSRNQHLLLLLPTLTSQFDIKYNDVTFVDKYVRECVWFKPLWSRTQAEWCATYWNEKKLVTTANATACERTGFDPTIKISVIYISSRCVLKMRTEKYLLNKQRSRLCYLNFFTLWCDRH